MIRIPARLTYNPKAYVYTKDQSGTVYNLTPWVTAGQVQRMLNQVSSAEVTLRNPYRRFTTPPVAFHPMDPITIYLERIAGYPIRVFTGYLDTTPYYQLYPGTITLQASCTLKRLLYTWFDPSLPYVISFFTKYGWINTGSGSIINPSAIHGPTVLNTTQLQDASFGKLLWATLFEIGEWQDGGKDSPGNNIFVENLPDGIAQRIQQLMSSMQAGLQTAGSEFTTFLNNVIGAGSQGTGGNSTTFTGGPLTSPSGLTIKGSPMTTTQMGYANIILSTGQSLGSSSTGIEVVLVQGIAESSMGGSDMGWDSMNQNYGGLLGGAVGTFSKYGSSTSTAVAQQESISAFKGINGYNLPGGALAYHGTNILQAAMTNSGSGSQYLTEAGYQQWTGEAQAIVNAAGKSGGSSVGAAVTQAGKKGAQALTNNSNGVTNPIPGWTIGRDDAGVDATAPQGTAVLAPAACTLVSPSPVPGWDGNFLYLFKFDSGVAPNATSQWWYVAEGVSSPGSVGTHFNQGETVCVSAPSLSVNHSIEIGWGNPTVNSCTYAEFSSGNTSALTNPGSTTPYAESFKNYFSVGGGSPVKGGTGGTGGAGGIPSTNTAEAFVAELQFPSIQDQVTAIALGAEHKGLMHDQQLMPFVQQLAQSSCRSFQSLPNGDFYAFYPDYFGEFGHRPPYWLIDDIEVLDGGVSLSDDSLATHVFAVGDNTFPVNEELLNMLFSAGTINVFNAFLTPGLIDTKKNPFKDGRIDGHKATGMQSVMNGQEAIDFIKRYGARPLVQNYPMVHSNLFEMLLAYEQFMLAWANQFKSPFTFTFMPELYPGGKVGFPNHGLQMYINAVTHTWSYEESGFTTTAELTAPSLLVLPDGSTVNPGDFPELPPNMVKALVEPIHNASQPSSATQQTTTIFHNLADSLAQFHQSNQNR